MQGVTALLTMQGVTALSNAYFFHNLDLCAS